MKDLAASYEACRRVCASHGRTYYLATSLVPAAKRPFIHALYGFARVADQIVDEPGPDPAGRLAQWRRDFHDDLRRGSSGHPIRAAVIDTVLRWEIQVELFDAFLDAMAMDLTVTRYETYADLCRYMHGSAEVIGLQLLPILEPATPAAAAHAANLGRAFQLANFVRDVGEDLTRGRIYLPLEDLERFGATPADLLARTVTPPVRATMQFQVARVRRLERHSRPGIAMLHPSVRDCVDTARILYCGIVDAVEALDYEVFARRATVSTQRRLAVAVPAAARALVARQVHGSGRVPD